MRKTKFKDPYPQPPKWIPGTPWRSEIHCPATFAALEVRRELAAARKAKREREAADLL